MLWSDITMGTAIFGLVVSACSPSISSWIEYRSKLKIARFSHFSKSRAEAASALLAKIGEFRSQPSYNAERTLSALYAYSLYASSSELTLIQTIAAYIISEEYDDAVCGFDELQRLMVASTERLYRLDPRHKKPR